VITKDWEKTANLLNNGKVGIIPTDTIYGISCPASQKELVERIYKIKARGYNKPFIILISSKEELNKFEINTIKNNGEVFNKYWPGPVSIILDVNRGKYRYLHRGTKTLVFRVPKHAKLIELLKKTGPLVSTSANISENIPVKCIGEAEKIFGNKLDFYLDAGYLNNPPSKIVRIVDDKEIIVRT
jgi:L-threonylcarbamoyladenylate synthase